MPTSSDVVVQCEGLAKLYRIGERERYPTLRDAIVAKLSRRIGGPPEPRPVIWALDDVSFELRRGEVLGIIGRNGAGKSTLLKILSRITRPTRGRASIRGTVGSLLEVGTGFHQELTGRENVYLNGTILGMKRRDIAARFDEIIAFAEIGNFLDTPVKRYSSGMYMRLAFAVAAHLETDILFVDEVLAVGDVAFQKKCLGKIGSAARAGRTVIFVSHNMVAVEGLCSSAIWIQSGRVAERGQTQKVIGAYLDAVSENVQERDWSNAAAAPKSERVILSRIRVRPESADEAVTVRTPLVVEVDYETLVPGLRLNVAISVHNESGVLAFASGNEAEASMPAGTYRTTGRIPGDLLNDGRHFISVMLIRDDANVEISIDHALVFQVDDNLHMRGAWYGHWPGVVRPHLSWSTERLS